MVPFIKTAMDACKFDIFFRLKTSAARPGGLTWRVGKL